MNVVIRTFEERDREAVVALWYDVFPDRTGRNEPHGSIDRKVAAEDGLFLVAEEDGNVVGTAMGGYDGHRGWLYSIAVRPEQRRGGLGSRLVEAVEERLRELGCPKVNLQVLPENGDVVGFYASLGYAVEERISMGRVL